MAPIGIATTIVEPGPFRTEFLGRSMQMAAAEMPEYAETAGVRRRYRADHDGQQAGDPQKAIDVVLPGDRRRTPAAAPPPRRSAYTVARTRFAAFLESMDGWEPPALNTSFDEPDPAPPTRQGVAHPPGRRAGGVTVEA